MQFSNCSKEGGEQWSFCAAAVHGMLGCRGPQWKWSPVGPPADALWEQQPYRHPNSDQQAVLCTDAGMQGCTSNVFGIAHVSNSKQRRVV